MQTKILIVEDETKLVRTLRLYLEEAQFSVAAVHDGAQAVPAFRQERPELVLLDLNLPGTDGLDVCRALRRDSNVPIIIITARSDEVDRLIGLELGADDYLVKPFSPREMVARVRAVLRRTTAGLAADTLRAGELLLDLTGHRAWIGEHSLDLTQTEFELLSALVRNAGRALTRTQLLDDMPGLAHDGYERSIDQHVKNLRRKIKETSAGAAVIETVYGIGYRLDKVNTTTAKAQPHVP